MTVSTRVALWILNRFGSSGTRTIVAGDLLEECARGRSAMWVWHQVVSTIALETIYGVRGHWMLAVRAWATMIAAYAVVAYVPIALIGPLRMSPFNYLFVLSAQSFVAAWIAGRTHRRLGIAAMPWIVLLVALSSAPDVLRLLVDAFDDGRYAPYLVSAAIRAALACASAFVGATLGVPPSGDQQLADDSGRSS